MTKHLIFLLGLSISLSLLLFPQTVQAQTVKGRIAVAGNCEHCKERLESALDIKGIRFVRYNPETHWLEVQYTSKAFTMDDIEKRIALLGHDTERYKAADSTYNALPGCCRYERPFPFPKEAAAQPSSPQNR